VSEHVKDGSGIVFIGGASYKQQMKQAALVVESGLPGQSELADVIDLN